MNGVYTRFLHRRATNAQDLTTAGALRALLLRSTGSYTFNPDHDFVSDLFSNGGVEISVPSYTRKTLTTVQWTLDDTNDYTVLKFDNIPYGNLETGQTVVACVIFEPITIGTPVDANSPLVYHLDGKVRVIAAAPAALSTTGNITGATQANPVVITSPAHNLVNGQTVYLSGLGGMAEINNRSFVVAGAATNAFALTGENGTGYGAYTTGGTWTLVRPVYVEPLKEAINDGVAVTLGTAAGFVNGNHNKFARVFNVRGLTANVIEGDSGIHQTALNLPVNLGGGSFNVNINAAGFLALLGTKP
jgi:hypothetical protein